MGLKMKNRRGETLVETLASVMIVAITVGFLATAVVSASRISAKLREVDYGFFYVPESSNAVSVTVDGVTKTIEISENNGYYYYGG